LRDARCLGAPLLGDQWAFPIHSSRFHEVQGPIRGLHSHASNFFRGPLEHRFDQVMAGPAPSGARTSRSTASQGQRRGGRATSRRKGNVAAEVQRRRGSATSPRKCNVAAEVQRRRGSATSPGQRPNCHRVAEHEHGARHVNRHAAPGPDDPTHKTCNAPCRPPRLADMTRALLIGRRLRDV